ncbi:WYL domain-containing protein [bacterium]|nr:WYL domain-containing protein [bacterium]MBU1956925.1 WYL domain-containing protein [bacterium]
MAINKKTNALFKLMERFLVQKEINSQDKDILQEFACDKKTLERYLKDIESLYDHIITIKRGKQNVWKLISISDIFNEFIKNSENISQLFLMAQEFDPEIFKELEKGTLSKIAKNDEHIFLFKNSIMEELQSEHAKEIFKKLKLAIRNSEYRDIVYTYDSTTVYKNAKCIKLVFMDNNWYLILIDDTKKLLFRRLSFIAEVNYASKSTFHRNDIQPYLDFLARAQNSMTLYDVAPKVATIKATPNIAKYFEKDMKKFLLSQTFLETCDDGGVLFTINYTQELEIFPFIQKWMPDLIIIEPLELKESYIKKLNATLENHLN